MREFLIAICPVAIWCIVVIELLLVAMLWGMFRKTKQPIALLSALLAIGLIIDAAILGLGAILPESVLAAISPVRYVAHGMLIPLLFPICAYALTDKKPVLTVVWIFTALVMIAGVAEGLVTMLEPTDFAGVVRFVSAKSTPRWASVISRVLSFGTVIPMMIVGIIVWIKQKTPHLFFSGFLMFAFSALGPATGNSDLIFFISMFGEALMILFLYLYAKHKALKA